MCIMMYISVALFGNVNMSHNMTYLHKMPESVMNVKLSVQTQFTGIPFSVSCVCVFQGDIGPAGSLGPKGQQVCCSYSILVRNVLTPCSL